MALPAAPLTSRTDHVRSKRVSESGRAETEFNSLERALNATATGIHGMRATSSLVSVEKAENENEDIMEDKLMRADERNWDENGSCEVSE